MEDQTTPHQQLFDSKRLELVKSSKLSLEEVSDALPTYTEIQSTLYRKGKKKQRP